VGKPLVLPPPEKRSCPLPPAGPTHVRDSFRCAYTHRTATPADNHLRVYLTRSLEGLTGDGQQQQQQQQEQPQQQEQQKQFRLGTLSHPIAHYIARGKPLCLCLWVPLWVVNGTQLPVSTGVVTVPAPKAGQHGGAAGGEEVRLAREVLDICILASGSTL